MKIVLRRPSCEATRTELSDSASVYGGLHKRSEQPSGGVYIEGHL